MRYDSMGNQGMPYGGMDCSGMLHVVEKGDTLYKIAKKYGVPLSKVMYANPYVNVYNLQVGDEICVPMWRGKEKCGKEKFGKEKFGKEKFGKEKFEREKDRTTETRCNIPNNMGLEPRMELSPDGETDDLCLKGSHYEI